MYENCVLYKQWLEYQKNFLLSKNVEIDGLNDEEISFYYFEYCIRVPGKLPYKVHLSRELLSNSKYAEFKEAIENIKYKAQMAEDITPYLSKGILKIKKPDKMLNDWGVLHFHLGNDMKNGFISRTGELLFAYRDININPYELYFLDIFEHGDWSKKRTIEIVHNNWKEAIEHYKIDSMIDIEPKLSEEDHLKVRNANINSAVELSDGSFYMTLGGGLTTMGTNFSATQLKIYYMKYFCKLEQDLIKKYNIKSENLELILDIDPPHIYLKNNHFLVEKAKMIPLSIPQRDYLLYFLPLQN